MPFMNIHSIHAIRTSFVRVEAMGHVAVLVFYKRLFELAPHLRQLFPQDIELQSQKLMDVLASVLYGAIATTMKAGANMQLNSVGRAIPS
jgi:hemoglobin-like flavoprotein